jgi:glycosyltransferase involved in cell wall biosynthesis
MDKSEDRRFRILFVMDSLFTGGAEFSTLNLAAWLKHRGDQVELICLKRKSPSYLPDDFDLAENVKTLTKTSFWGRVKELNGHIRRFRPDLVHSVLLTSNFTCRISKLFNRKPRYVESLVNRTYDRARFNDSNVSPLALRVYQLIDTLSHPWGTDYFHAVTHDIADHFARNTCVPSAKTEVIYRGRKPNPWAGRESIRKEVRRALGIGEDELILLNIGRHEYQKDQLTLLEAYVYFLAMYPGKSRVLIAGREGHESARLNDFVQRHSLQNHIRLLGHREDVQQLLAAADIFMLSSIFEGIGGVLIEAEAAGLPIICSDLRGLKEVVVPDVNALMVAPRDTRGFSDAMLRLARDPQGRDQFGRKSTALFCEKFELETSHQRMAMFYTKVMGK